MKINSRTIRFLIGVVIVGVAAKYLTNSNAAAASTSDQAEDISLVNSALGSAGGMLPALGLSQYGSFSSGQTVQIAGQTYSSALAATVNLDLLGSSGTINVAVNPNPLAVKLSGQLRPITIIPDQFSIRACCQKSGGPDLTVEVMKSNIQATVFRLSGAITIPALKLNSDVLLTYENGLLVAQTEKHDEIDAVLTIKIALPDPRQAATGVYFTLGGNFSRMLNEALRPLLASWAGDAASRCQSSAVDTSSAGRFLKKAASFVKNPEACGKAYLVEAVNGVLDGDFLVLNNENPTRGSWTYGDITSARAPKLENLDVQINLGILGSRNFVLPAPGRELQFDFKNPAGSAADIASQLFDLIKQSFGL